MSSVQQDIVDQFDAFFDEYYDDDIKRLANRFPLEQKSLIIDWHDLYEFSSDLAEDYTNQPEKLRNYAEEALRNYSLSVQVDLSDAHVRIRNCSNELPIRGLRADDVNQLVNITGVVRNTTGVRPKLLNAAYECQRCGTETKIQQHSSELEEPQQCDGCERQGPFRINYGNSKFIDSQAIRVQERPEGLRGGETPQNIDIRIRDDIVGDITSGDIVDVTGILRLEDPTGQDKSTTFDMYVEGVTLRSRDEKFEDMNITEEDRQQIEDRSNLPDIYDQFRDSIAPSIYGYPNEKMAIMLQMFGGYTKYLPDQSRIRGDMHILLIGDPGTGKSQLLQYIKKVAPRCVYASGKGSSAAGLTASAVQQDMGEGSEWTLEAGTLVLADKGVAAIDELDKMSADDRSALHEGLEQQEISVNKAGINATLKSRCSLLGAANPKYGRFDEFEPIPEQIDLDPALISRFDLIFTVTDKPDPEKDRQLAKHILNSNFAGQLNTKEEETGGTVSDDDADEYVDDVEPSIKPEDFRKYIAYAKQNCFPELTDEARNHIEDFYVDLRAEGLDDDAAVPVTARKLEGIVRLAEASARVRLSDTATIEDAERATEMVHSSLIDIGIDPETGEFDADRVEAGASNSQRNRIKNLKGIIKELQPDDSSEGAELEEVKEMALSTGMTEDKFEHEIEKLTRSGDLYKPSHDKIRAV